MRKTELVQKIEILKKDCKVLEDIVIAQNREINYLNNAFQPATYENGVLVSMAKVKFDTPITLVNKTKGIKWYEDRLID